ncbi:hypothetical protein FACS1894140_6000 [Spirochaetia bacterium]|nr:hypothetical protein FACS1894140_6000 [Spirochaetia bacterium]
MPEPANEPSVRRDPKAPKFLGISSGSVGLYASDKITNPESGERYQYGLTFTLIGSKPEK